MPQKGEDDSRHGDHDFDEGRRDVVDRFLDQIGAVVDRHHLHAGRQSRLDLPKLRLDARNDVERILAVAHHDNAGDGFAVAVEVSRTSAQLGTEHDVADVFDADRRAALGGGERDVPEVGCRLRVAVAAHHVLGAAEFNHASADVVVASADRLDHAADRQAVRPQSVGIDVHLVLPHVAAKRRDVGDAANAPEVIPEIPVLVRAEFRERVRVRFVREDVLEDPSESGRVGTELGRRALRKARQHRREVLERPRPRPVDVGAVFEDDVDVRVAEVGHAAYGFHARRAEERRHNRIRHLRIDDVGAAVPARVHDHLRVAEIRERVERHVDHRPRAGDRGENGRHHDDGAMSCGPLDDGRNHGRDRSSVMLVRMRCSASTTKAPATTTRSPALRPFTIWTRPPRRQPVSTSRGSKTPARRSTNTVRFRPESIIASTGTAIAGGSTIGRSTSTNMSGRRT